MRLAGLGVLAAVLIGCDVPPAVNAPSTEAPLILEGLELTDPYFGRFKEVDAPDREAGDVMLALCGCDCWRVMMLWDDGGVRTQLLVHFSPQSGSESTEEVIMQGQADGAILNGTVDQVAGSTEGRVLIGPYAMVFVAQRSKQEADQVETCTACHFGEEPLWRIPTEHAEYQRDPPDCLTCHSLD